MAALTLAENKKPVENTCSDVIALRWLGHMDVRRCVLLAAVTSG